MSLYLVIPAYNESPNLREVVVSWGAVLSKCDPTGKILVVNDGSRDDSEAVLAKLTTEFLYLEVINKKNSGHGPSCLVGYQEAINRGASYVFQTDSDGQTDPNDFYQFWERREHREYCDAQIGKRFNRGDGLSRVFVSLVLRLVVFVTLRVNTKDSNTPFRLIKAHVLQEFLNFCPKDFQICNALMSGWLVKNKKRVAWFPVHFYARRGGEQSINMRKIVKLGFETFLRFLKI